MRPTLALSMLVLLMASIRVWADAPRICYASSGGGTSVVIGDGFDSTAKVVTWNTAVGQKDLLKYAGDLSGPAALPATPPSGARVLDPVHVANSQVLDVALPPESTVVWVRTAGGISAPRLVNAPQIWLVTDENPVPGEQMRLFGRNFSSSDREAGDSPDYVVVFRNRSTGKITIARTARLAEQYWEHTVEHVAGVIVPQDLKPGPYDILVHSAFSGAFGWSAPYKVDVVAHRSLAAAFARLDQASRGLAIRVTPVTGLAGNGLHDDTSTIQAALDHAAASGGGVVLLPAGQFAISKTLRIEPGVFLRGAGEDASSIVISPTAPLSGGLPELSLTPSLSWQRGYSADWKPYMREMTPMIWMQTRSGISDLSLIGGPGVTCTILVATRDWHTISEDVSIVRVDVSSSQRHFLLGGYHEFVFGVTALTATRNFTIAQCHFRCSDPFWLLPARPSHYGATITNNTFEVFPRQATGSGGTSSLTHSVIEDNDFIGGSRALGFSRGASCNWVFNNRVTDDGGYANAEEMFMSEYGVAVWGGPCQSASASAIQAQGAEWSAGQFLECSDPIFVFIKLGKGFGQFRQVTANTADTLTVDAPWDIVPDSTSRFVVLMATYRDLYINNQAIHCNGRCEFAYGSLVDCVVEGLNTRDCEGISTTAIDGGIAAFNDYEYNRLIGMSGIHIEQGRFWDDTSVQIPGVDTGSNQIGNVIANTVRYNEVMNFREYALNQYGTYWNNIPPSSESPGISVSGGSFNVIDDNYVTNGAVGIRIGGGDANVVTHNRIDDVLTTIRDGGRDTFTGVAGG